MRYALIYEALPNVSHKLAESGWSLLRVSSASFAPPPRTLSASK